MARRVSRPSAYGFGTASGIDARIAKRTISAPRTRRRRFSTSDLPDGGPAEDARGANGEREDEEDEAGRLAPAAPDEDRREALQRAEEEPDHHHAEPGLEAGDHRDREGLEDEDRGHRRADGGDGGDEDAGERRDRAGERVGKHHRPGGRDPHELARVAVGGDRVEGLAEERAALEQLDRRHHRDHPGEHGELERGHVHAEHVDRGARDGGREGPVVPAPDVLGEGEEEQPPDDGEEDPALAPLLEREPDRRPLHDEAEERTDEEPERQDEPVREAEADEREAREGRDHHQLALAEVDALARRVGELEPVRDERVHEPEERAAHRDLREDGEGHGGGRGRTSAERRRAGRRTAPPPRPVRYLAPRFWRRARSASFAKMIRPSFASPITVCSRRKASWVVTSAGLHFEYGFTQVAITPSTGSFRSSRAFRIALLSVDQACFTAAAKRRTAS